MPDLSLERADAERLAAALGVLADPSRLRILARLAGRGPAVTGKDIRRVVGHLAQPTVSHHVRLLVDAGYVAQDRRGVYVYHRLTVDGHAALKAVLRIPGGEQ
jgi:ArsR family transcriptional regulator